MKTWDTICQGSKITLSDDKILKSFNDEVREVKKGTYYITGFWADMVGLSQKSSRDLNDLCIKSTELTAFNEVASI